MDNVGELASVIFALTVVLSLVLPIVFVVQKVRGTPTREALRFAGIGFGVCFGVAVTFVLGITAIGAAIDPDDTLRAQRECDQIGGELQSVPTADGEISTICVVQ